VAKDKQHTRYFHNGRCARAGIHQRWPSMEQACRHAGMQAQACRRAGISGTLDGMAWPRRSILGRVWQACAHPVLLEALHEPTDVRDG
jgi:hypothetical protein